MLLGRPWPGPGEPLWTDADRDWAIALLSEEQETCACGQLRSESTAAENEYAYDAVAVRCHACAARDREARRFSSSDARSATDGLIVVATRR